MEFHIREARLEDMAGLLKIYNSVIETSTAVNQDNPLPLENREPSLGSAAQEEQLAGLIGAEGEADLLFREPIRQVRRSGDLDPGLFRCTLESEYALARTRFGFSEEELAAIAENGFKYAFAWN